MRRLGLVVSFSDGGNQGGSGQFTATSTTFTLILSEGGGTLVRVYTKS